MDAADELGVIVLARLTELEEINRNTFESDHPINVGPIQRWIEDLRQTVTRFNLKTLTVPDNPLFGNPRTPNT
jgi:hypothetical protein